MQIRREHVEWIVKTVAEERWAVYPDSDDHAKSEALCWADARREELMLQIRDGKIVIPETPSTYNDQPEPGDNNRSNIHPDHKEWSCEKLADWLASSGTQLCLHEGQRSILREAADRLDVFSGELRRLKSLAAHRTTESAPPSWFELEAAESVLRMCGYTIPHGKQVS
jgi:hypothetical protein